MSNIYLFFPNYEKIHQGKDVFIFPAAIARKLGIPLTIIYDGDDFFEDTESVKFINLQYKKKYSSKLFLYIMYIKFFIKSLNNIKFLFLFHYCFLSLSLSFILKSINKKLYIYLKGDMDMYIIESIISKKKI